MIHGSSPTSQLQWNLCFRKGQSGRLSELTCDILKAAGRLTGQVHSPLVLKRVADLVRQMNCYYSNLIEGHKTIPRDMSGQ